MKKSAILLFSLLSTLAIGQNLVQNGSIENTGDCPILSSALEDIAEPWTNFFGTPDYFHQGCGFPGSQTTTNNTQPFDGQGFVGIQVYGSSGPNYLREYIHGELKEPLEEGKFYRVTFYVKPLHNDDQLIGYGINNIGLLLTDTVVDSIPPANVYQAVPQVVAKEPIVTKSYWTAICGIIKAKGGEKYITIGNFNVDAATTVAPLEGASAPPEQAYYMVDFVEVVENDYPQLPADTIICTDQRIDLIINAPDVNVVWSDGTTEKGFMITEPGTYYATIFDLACSYVDTIRVEAANCNDCKIYVPNAFTPNGDKKNDEFVVTPSCEENPTEDYFISYHIKIFDRWGQKLFESDSPEISWDGENGETGVYTYTIQYEFHLFRESQTLTKRGVINLIR